MSFGGILVRTGFLVFVGVGTISQTGQASEFNQKSKMETANGAEQAAAGDSSGRPKARAIQDVARIRIQPMELDGAGNEVAMGFPALCSGFQVKSRKGPIHFVTAGHCLPNEVALDFPNEPSKTYFVVDDGLITNQENEKSLQEGYVSEVQTDRLNTLSGFDIGFFKTSRMEFQTTKIHSLAMKPLKFGDPAKIVGYPGGFGPVTFECKYVGIGLRTEGYWDAMVAIDELECPGLGSLDDDIGGMSGGLILNKRNQVVGVIVQQIQSRTNGVEDSGFSEMTRVGFLPLTERNLNRSGLLYKASRMTGRFHSRYIDWTTGNEVKVEFELLNGRLNGNSKIRDLNGTEIEDWNFQNGYWF